MQLLEPIRRGAEGVIDTLGEGWDRLRERSSSALTRFRRMEGDEAAYGSFTRRLALPCSVDSERAEARYRHGVLTVRLPRPERDRRKRIRVEAS